MDKNELRLLEGHNIIITPVKDGASDEYPWAYNSQKMRLEKVYSSYIFSDRAATYTSKWVWTIKSIYDHNQFY